MAGIQQSFQQLFRLGAYNALLGGEDTQGSALAKSIKELARIAGVSSEGCLVEYPEKFQGKLVKTLSPRHEFFLQFDIAIRLSDAIKQIQETFKAVLEQYPDICESFLTIKTALAVNLQTELEPCSSGLRSHYKGLCEFVLCPKDLSEETRAEIRAAFCLPDMKDAKIQELRQAILAARASVHGLDLQSSQEAATALQVALEDEQGKLALAQAGHEKAISKLYAADATKAAGCHLVAALSCSPPNLTNVQKAIERIDFSKAGEPILHSLFKVAPYVFRRSTIQITSKAEVKTLLYTGMNNSRNLRSFLFQLLAIEMISLQPTELPPKNQENVMFTSGYLLQLACANLHAFFKESRFSRDFCKDLLQLQAEIGGRDHIYYQVTPEQMCCLRTEGSSGVTVISLKDLEPSRATCSIL